MKSTDSTPLSTQAPTAGSRLQVAIYSKKDQTARFTLPYAGISVNSLYRTYNNRVIKSKRGREWMLKTLEILMPLRITYYEPVQIRVEAWYKDRRKWDCDGIIKPLLDAIEAAGIIENDNQVYKLTVIKHDYDESKPNGEVWVDIYPFCP